MKLVFIVPVLNEEGTLETLVEGIARNAGGNAFRILFVDDGSTDGSMAILRGLYEKHSFVDVIRFRRNMGKTAALTAAFAAIDLGETDIVFTMDADLQDDPAEIPRFLEAMAGGADMVVGWKKVRHDPWHKTIPSRVYNGAVSWLFGLAIHDVNCGFKAMRARVAEGLRLRGDLHRLIPVLASRAGYRVVELAVNHRPRRFGTSKYGVGRFFKGAFDVLYLFFFGKKQSERAIDLSGEIEERLLH